MSRVRRGHPTCPLWTQAARGSGITCTQGCIDRAAAMPAGESALARSYRLKSHLRCPVDNGNKFAFRVPCVRCLTIASSRLGYLMACKYPIHIPPIRMTGPALTAGPFSFGWDCRGLFNTAGSVAAVVLRAQAWQSGRLAPNPRKDHNHHSG
jgi:hypothetical protein